MQGTDYEAQDAGCCSDIFADIQASTGYDGDIRRLDTDTVRNAGMKNMNDAVDITQSLMSLDFNADDFFDDNDSWEIKKQGWYLKQRTASFVGSWGTDIGL